MSGVICPTLSLCPYVTNLREAPSSYPQQSSCATALSVFALTCDSVKARPACSGQCLYQCRVWQDTMASSHMWAPSHGFSMNFPLQTLSNYTCCFPGTSKVVSPQKHNLLWAIICDIFNKDWKFRTKRRYELHNHIKATKVFCWKTNVLPSNWNKELNYVMPDSWQFP